MTSSLTIGYIDNSGEGSSTRFYLPQLTAGNYDAVAGNGVGENVGDLRLAVAAVTLCNFTQHTVVAEQYTEAGDLPASAFAQREFKLLVKMVDTANNRSTVTIPAPNLDVLAQPGTDIVDHVSNVVAAALAAAIEANAVSPQGNALSVIGMRIVGRAI